MEHSKRWAALALAAVMVVALASCGGFERPSITGSVLLNLGSVQARSILPPISMNCTEYLVSGTGPSGSTYGPTLFTASGMIEDLLPGTWDFSVIGRNADHNDIGSGTGSAFVVVGTTATCSITVAEYSSPDGSFLLDLAWEPDIVFDPVWAGTLKDYAAVLTPMVFTVDELACTAQSLTDPLHVGWFAMIVQLFDAPTGLDGSEVLSTGAAAAVRIAAGRQTHGDMFLHAVQGFGKIDLQITPDFNDELVLTPSDPFGDVTVYSGGSKTFTVTADETASSIYYLRGQQVGIDSYTVNADSLILGEAYRLDVVSFNVDGSRAASGTWRIIADSTPPNYGVTLKWNTLVVGQPYIVKVYNDSWVQIYSSLELPATGGQLTFNYTLPAAGSYGFRVNNEITGAKEYWQEAGTTAAATLVAFPTVELPILDFGALNF